jgi:hypothetical protein
MIISGFRMAFAKPSSSADIIREEVFENWMPLNT